MADEVESVTIDYAIRFYAALKKHAKVETVKGTKTTVFRGSVTPVYDSLGISRGHYGRIMKGLEEAGALAYVQRGNSRQESIIVLQGAPKREVLASIDHLTKPSDRRRLSSDELTKRVVALEGRLGKDINYIDALVDIERRLVALEGRQYEDGTETQ